MSEGESKIENEIENDLKRRLFLQQSKKDILSSFSVALGFVFVVVFVFI